MLRGISYFSFGLHLLGGGDADDAEGDGEDAAQKGQNYLYPHDYPGHWVKQQYLPDALAGVRYYEYGQNKNEQAAKAYWDKIKK